MAGKKDRFFIKKPLLISLVLTLILLVVISCASTYKRSRIAPVTTSKINTALPVAQNSPDASLNINITEPEEQTAQEDINFMSSSNMLPINSIRIPKGAKYYHNEEFLQINLDNGMKITISATGQLFIPDCGGLSAGNEEGGECVVQEMLLEKDVTIGKYYRSADPEKIFGYYDNYYNVDGKVLGLRVLTNDFRVLSVNDKKILYSIISSIK